VGWTLAALWLMTFLGARLVLDKDWHLPQWIKVTAALVPILPTAIFLWCIVRGIGQLDELHQRVHLEALAIAFPLTILMLMTLGLLQLAIDLNMDDWSYRHVWCYLPLFYFAGLALAWSRYR
jgi:hypothetical protein